MEVKSGEGTVVVADRNPCEVMKGQQEIKCLIEKLQKTKKLLD